MFFFFFNDTATTEIYTFPTRRSSDLFQTTVLPMSAGAVGRLPPIDVKLNGVIARSEEHTSELQSQSNIVCRLLLEKKKPLAGRLASRALAMEARCPAVYPKKRRARWK